MHIVSDLAIFGAYVAIPCVLLYFIRKRRDVPFTKLFVLFGLFILSCGTGHLIEATIFWFPWYRFSGVSKAFTAVVSWATVLAMIPIMPRALALPGLPKVNERLKQEVRDRKTAEAQLQHQADELHKTNTELERFMTATSGRERRVLELKAEVNQLLARLNEAPRYRSISETDST